MPSYDYKIFADYHQFYLMDDAVQPLIPEDVTDEDCQRRVKELARNNFGISQMLCWCGGAGLRIR